MGMKEDAKRLLPIVQAVAEGKAVQFLDGGNWVDKETASFSAVTKYRIKLEREYRPYTRDEFVEFIGFRLRIPDWDAVVAITAVTDKHFYNGMDSCGRTFAWALEKCEWLDGQPCGVKVEGEDARTY